MQCANDQIQMTYKDSNALELIYELYEATIIFNVNILDVLHLI